MKDYCRDKNKEIITTVIKFNNKLLTATMIRHSSDYFISLADRITDDVKVYAVEVVELSDRRIEDITIDDFKDIASYVVELEHEELSEIF